MERRRINPTDTLPQGVLMVAHASHVEQPGLGSKFPSVSSPLSTPPPHPDAAARCPRLQAGAPPSTHLPDTWLQRVKKEVPGADNATARPRGTNPVWILDESCPSTPSTSAGRRAKRRKRKRRQEPEHSSHPQTGGVPPPTATNDESPAKKKPQPSSVVMKGLHAINDVTATKPCDRAHDSSSSSQSSTVARSPLVKTEQSVVNLPPPISHLVTDKANNGLTDGLAQAATTSTSNVANERQQVVVPPSPHQSSTNHAKKKQKRPPVSNDDDDALDPRHPLHISSSSSSSDNDAVVVMVTKQPKSGSSPELTPGARRRRRRRLLASKVVTVDLTEPDTKKAAAAVVRLDESDQSDASGNVVALNSLAELLPSMATPITDAVADDKAVEQGEVEGVGEGASVAGPSVDDTSSLILQQLAEQDEDDDIVSTLDLALLGTITDKDDSTDGGGPAGEDTLPATLQIESQTVPTLPAAASVPTGSPLKHPATTTPLREQGPTDDGDAAAIGGMDGSVESSSTGASKGGVKSTDSDHWEALSSAPDAAIPRDQPLESDVHGVGGLPLTPELVLSLPDESSDQRRATDNKEELGAAQPSSSSNDYDAALVEMSGEDGAVGSILSGADEPALSSPIKATQSAVQGDSSAPVVTSAHVEPSTDVVADVDMSCEPNSSSGGPPETAAAAPTTTEEAPLVDRSDGQARYPPTNTTEGNNSPSNNPSTDEVVVPSSDLVPLVTAPKSYCHPLEPPVTLRLDEAAEGGTAADGRPRRRKRITTLPTSSAELEGDLSSDGYVSEDDMGLSGRSDDDDSGNSPSVPSNHDQGGMLVTPTPLVGERTPFVPGPQKEVPSFAVVYATPTPSAASNQPADEDPALSAYPRPPFPCKEALIAAAFDESDTNHREEEEESDDDKAPPPPPPPSNPPRRLPVEGHPPPPLPPDSPLRLQAKQLPPHIYNAKTPLLDNMFSSSSSSSSSGSSSDEEEGDAAPTRTPHDHPFRYAKPTPRQLLLPSEDEEEVEFGGSSSDDDVVLVGVIPAPSSASSTPRTPILPPPTESLHPVLRGTYNVAAHEATWTGTWGFTETLPSAPTKFAYKCVAPHWASHDVRVPLTGAYTGYFFVMGEGGHSRPQKVLEKGVHLEFTELAPGSYVVDGVGRNKFGPFSLRGYFEWGHPLTLVKMYTPAA
ncbi:hypothetical protein B5M09_010198 [Aphanomyces astaci]|uniref:Uncharacterized protein n=1 Tax=Aphanomyces astaci TaxID=112090 RepID=A0A425CVK6_APHAT|nr:hypothetical protein B5M09_010198 [Aphanomyces astaci]